jgi:hypothetical protein
MVNFYRIDLVDAELDGVLSESRAFELTTFKFLEGCRAANCRQGHPHLTNLTSNSTQATTYFILLLPMYCDILREVYRTYISQEISGDPTQVSRKTCWLGNWMSLVGTHRLPNSDPQQLQRWHQMDPATRICLPFSRLYRSSRLLRLRIQFPLSQRLCRTRPSTTNLIRSQIMPTKNTNPQTQSRRNKDNNRPIHTA